MDASQERWRLGEYNRIDLPPTCPKQVIVCDVTVREGEQTAGVSFSLDEKIELARRLDAAGIGQIQLNIVWSEEAKKEVASFARLNLRAKIEAMTRGNIDDWRQEVDRAIDAGADVIHSNLAVSPYIGHMYSPMTPEQFVERTYEIVEYAHSRGAKAVNLSYLDAPRTPWPVMRQMVRAATQAGAERIRFPDSVGTSTPRGMAGLMKMIAAEVKEAGAASPLIGVHCHNDFGLAAANTIAAIEHGAGLVDLAVNNLGERAGNADLAQVVAVLETVYGIRTGIDMGGLADLYDFVSRLSGIPVQPNQPLTGKHVYADLLGIHMDAVAREPFSFQGIAPEVVGNERRILLGKMSNTTTLALKLRDLNLHVEEALMAPILSEIKERSKQLRGRVLSDDDIRRIVESNQHKSQRQI